MTITEDAGLGDFLKFEIDKNYCRETVTVASGQNLKRGTVVGIVTATGFAKIVSIDPEEEDGSDMAIGVILEDVYAMPATKKSVMIARGAIVADKALIFPAGATDAQKKKISKDLESRGIVTRKAV
jgi:hypothetical protein